jgi:hypothetical protein
MAKTVITEPGERKSIGGDFVIPLAALVFTLYYFSTIIDSPWTAQVAAFFIGAILITLILLFLIKSAIAIARAQADLRIGALSAPTGLLPTRLALLAITIGYLVLIERGGFTLTTFGFLLAAMLLLNRGRKGGVVVGLSLAVSLGGYLIFILAFDTRFPRGPFEELVQAVM